MKKALKILMLALLVVPCALVFTACNKNIGNQEVTKYVYDSYKKIATNETYETWKDVKLTKHQEEETATEVLFDVQSTSGTTSKQKKEGKTTTVADLTVERKGQEEDTVIVATSKTVTTETSYALNEDNTGVDCFVTKTTETYTLYLGRIGTKDEGTYYAAAETKREGTRTKNGTADTEYAEGEGKLTTTKNLHTFNDATAYETTVTAVSSYLLASNFAYVTYVPELVADGYELKATQNGKNVTINLTLESNYEPSDSYASLTNENYTLKAKDYEFSSLAYNYSYEKYNSTNLTNEKNAVKETIDATYSSNAKMLTQTDVDGYAEAEDFDVTDFASSFDNSFDL